MTSPEISLHGFCFEDLTIGMSDMFGKTITEADIILFAGISCDTNPIHLNHDFAKNTIFGSRIAHGILSASFISTVIGTKLPGPGSIYVSQNLRFKAPVYSGDTLVAQCTITNLIPERLIVELETQCIVKNNIVVDGEATVKVPSKHQS